MRAWLGRIVRVLLPLVVGLLVTPRTHLGDTLWPWQPHMADLEVYRRAGEVLLAGGNVLQVTAPETGLPFVYPPFAALLCLPLALLPEVVVELGWVLACVLALRAVLHRLGLRGWQLALVTAVVLVVCEPVRSTLRFGQLGILLVATVVLDLVPKPGRPARGIGTGLVSAVKLTPGLFAVFGAFLRHWRMAAGVAGTALLLTLATAVVLPAESLQFFGRLAGGDTRASDLHYLMNQSVLGGSIRLLGPGPVASGLGLLVAAGAAASGAYAAARWYRRGKTTLAVAGCGVATLLASPISWSHHFVWVVPLGMALLDSELPTRLRAVGWVFVGWVSLAGFDVLPYGHNVELSYPLWQQLISNLTPVLGLVLLALLTLDGRDPGRSRGRSRSPGRGRATAPMAIRHSVSGASAL